MIQVRCDRSSPKFLKMVYQKSYFKVLLGPEKSADAGYGSDEEELEPPKKHADRSGFDKMGDSNVFKRTRPFQIVQPRPKLERYPSGLQLSGLKLHRETSLIKQDGDRMEDGLVPYNTEITSFKMEPTNMEHAVTNSGSNTVLNTGPTSLDISNLSYPVMSTLQTARSSRLSGHYSSRVSRYFQNDFGFSSHRTDTFSGHSSRRGASADIKREMEEKANKHIRTCQVIGNVKRGSRAQISYLGFRHTVSPSQSPLKHYHMDAFSRNIPKSHTDSVLRVEPEQKNTPYVIQLRKNIGSISRIKQVGLLCQTNDPLPEISGRTLILGPGEN